jgi:hypothetical protein
MDSQTKLLIGLCILVPLLLVVNIALLSAFRKRNQADSERMVIQARNSLQQPFREEDEQLAELSKRVSDLQENSKKKE